MNTSLSETDGAAALAACAKLDAWVGPRRIYPISFCIPDHLVVAAPPVKDQDFAGGMSQGKKAYRFKAHQQVEYYRDYQRSFFGLTYKKSGWDCMRHLEVLANGCAPWFPGIEELPALTMTHYPRKLIASAMALGPNVRMSGNALARRDEASAVVSDRAAYQSIVAKMIDHVRTHLTTRAMAGYLLACMGKPQAKSVLYLSGGIKPDYQCDLLFHGLRELLGAGCVDAEKIWWMYQSATAARRARLYGYGFTYSGHLPEIEVDRHQVAEKIRKRAYDLIVFGSIKRCWKLLPLVRKHYAREEIALIDGEDACRVVGSIKPMRPKAGLFRRPPFPLIQIAHQGVYFKRELDDALVITFDANTPAS